MGVRVAHYSGYVFETMVHDPLSELPAMPCNGSGAKDGARGLGRMGFKSMIPKAKRHKDNGVRCMVAHWSPKGKLLPGCIHCAVCYQYVRPEKMRTEECPGAPGTKP